MDLDKDDELLRCLAAGNSIDLEQWPGLLSRLIPRLEKVAHEEFPIPQSAQTANVPSSPPRPDPSSQGSTQSADKENAPPPTINTPEPLPPRIQFDLTSITSTLTALFSNHPPHTVQRLAELVISPRQHYRTLPSYLHAVDRVVHVTSGAHVFPLPPAIPDPTSATILSNGTVVSGADPLSISWGNPSASQSNLGSDESLGGALLTPITWLTKGTNGTRSPLEGEVKTESTQMIEGPNGPGGVETVSISVNGVSSTRENSDIGSSSPSQNAVVSLRAEGGVTQGELLRQEQRAGVVPATQLQHHHRADTDGMGEDDEAPHARGPEKIGMEDMGPQSGSDSQRAGPSASMQGIDLENALGRRLDAKSENEAKVEEAPEDEGATSDSEHTPKREADEEKGGDEKRLKEEKDVQSEDGMEIEDGQDRTGNHSKLGEDDDEKKANLDASSSAA